MDDTTAELDDIIGSGEVAFALALGEACRAAVIAISERHVIDEAARTKLIGLVGKVAKDRWRSGHLISHPSDTETIARLAVQRLLGLESGSARHMQKPAANPSFVSGPRSRGFFTRLAISFLRGRRHPKTSTSACEVAEAALDGSSRRDGDELREQRP